LANDKEIGTVTSGSQGVFVGYPIAFAKIDPAFAKVGQQVQIAIRDQRVNAEVVRRPWYKCAKK
jgi:aminomethyltransferase